MDHTENDWGKVECMTWRKQVEGPMKAYKERDTITFRAGFKAFSSSSSQTPAKSYSRFDYTYTLIEADFSNYLEMGASAIALALGFSLF